MRGESSLLKERRRAYLFQQQMQKPTPNSLRGESTSPILYRQRMISKNGVCPKAGRREGGRERESSWERGERKIKIGI